MGRRETKSGLLPKKKTNADKIKEEREARTKAMSIDESYAMPQGKSQSAGVSEEEQKKEQPSDLAMIGREAGNAVQKKPEGYRPATYVETKTKRVQLVLQPSLHERVKEAAKNRNLSMNEYVHQVLEYATHND